AGLGGGIHADPGVLNREQDVRAWLRQRLRFRLPWIEIDIPRFDRHATAVRHGIARIDDEIYDRLLQLTGVGLHGANVGGELRAQLDILTDEPAQHPVQISDNGVGVEDLRLEHLLSTEDEELPGQPGGPFGRLLDFLNVEARAGIHAEILEQEPAGPENRGQQVIEVVRDPAG